MEFIAFWMLASSSQTITSVQTLNKETKDNNTRWPGMAWRSRQFLNCDKTWVCCNLMDQSSVHGNRWGSSCSPHYWASKPSSLHTATCPAGLMLFSHLGRPSQAIIKVLLGGHPVLLHHVGEKRRRNKTQSPWVVRQMSEKSLWKKHEASFQKGKHLHDRGWMEKTMIRNVSWQTVNVDDYQEMNSFKLHKYTVMLTATWQNLWLKMCYKIFSQKQCGDRYVWNQVIQTVDCTDLSSDMKPQPHYCHLE